MLSVSGSFDFPTYGALRATGVTTSTVESMEHSFKKDILRELHKGKGRILLHDEVEERPGVFSIIPIWEVVSEDEIMTPRDVFELVIKEGYRVRDISVFLSSGDQFHFFFKIDYGRIAIVRLGMYVNQSTPTTDTLSIDG